MATEIYQWTLSGTLAGQFVQTVQHVKAQIAAPVNPFLTGLAIAQTMVDAGGLVEKLMDCLPADYTATSLRVKQVLPTGGPEAIILANDFTSPIVGQRTGEISSAQVNPLIIWIPTTTPSKTGRIFLPGVSESDIDEMALVTALIEACNVFAAAYVAGWGIGITADTFFGCVLRRSPTVPHTPLSGDTILAGQVSPLIGTQRRRLHPV